MNNAVKSVLTVLAALAMVFVSCKKKEDIVVPSSVTLERQELTLTIGTEQTLTATVEPANAANKSLSWESSDAAVVSVSAKGKLKALAEGSAVITVSTFNGCKDKCSVTVWDGLVHVTGVSINQPAADMIVGDRITLSATVLPDDASDKSVSWSSSDSNVATVSNAGEVAAVGAGRTTITVTTVDGRLSDECVVSVSAYTIDVTTLEAQDIGFSKATLRGTAVRHTNESNPPSMGGRFVYGTVSDPEQLKASGSLVSAQYWGSDNIYTKVLSGLKSGTTYYYMAAVECNGELVYGQVESFSTEALAEPEAVDLGLSVKWASFNVGATKESQTGFYFQWGDQDVPDEYSWSEYSLCTGSAGTIFKYKASDGKTVLDPEDDIATNLLGDGWRMPTKEECAELGDDTKVMWQPVTVNGITGTRITSKTTDNSIFIPLSGVISGTSTSNTNFAYVWTSTVSSNGSYSYAWVLTASSSSGKPYTGNQTSRKDGCTVRAVKP